MSGGIVYRRTKYPNRGLFPVPFQDFAFRRLKIPINGPHNVVQALTRRFNEAIENMDLGNMACVSDDGKNIIYYHPREGQQDHYGEMYALRVSELVRDMPVTVERVRDDIELRYDPTRDDYDKDYEFPSQPRERYDGERDYYDSEGEFDNYSDRGSVRSDKEYDTVYFEPEQNNARDFYREYIKDSPLDADNDPGYLSESGRRQNYDYSLPSTSAKDHSLGYYQESDGASDQEYDVVYNDDDDDDDD